MANSPTDEINTEVQEVDQEDPQQKPSDIISVRQLFSLGGQNRIIYDIATNGSTKRTSGWKIHDGSNVEISGSGLGIFNLIVVWVDGSPYPQSGVINSGDGRTISFNIEDFNNFFSEGSQIEIQFVDTKNSANNRFLKQKFTYVQESQEVREQRKGAQGSDKEKLQQQNGKESNSFDPTNLILDAGGQAMGGVVGGIINNKNTPKTQISSRGGSASISKTTLTSQFQSGAELESGIDLEGSEQENEQVISSTDQISGGSQTISQSGTVTTENSGEISVGGTASVQSTVQNTISGTASTSGSLNVSEGRSVSGERQVTGTVNNFGSGQVSEQVSAGASTSVASEAVGGQAGQTSQNILSDNSVQAESVKPELNSTVPAEKEVRAQKSEEINSKVGIKTQAEVGIKENINTNIAKQNISQNKASPILASSPSINSYATLNSAASTNKGDKPLSPPAGLGTMKTLEVNLNKNLGGAIADGNYISGTRLPSSSNIPTKPQQSQKTKSLDVQLNQNTSLEVEEALPESNIPKENAEKQENLGTPVGNITAPSKGDNFEVKPGAEVKGQSLKPGRPLYSLSRPETGQEIENKLDTKNPKADGIVPGGEKFQMPNAPEEERNVPGENSETETSQESGEEEGDQAGINNSSENEDLEEDQSQTPDIGGALQGTEEGAKLGAELGPEGAAIGAAAGAIVGSGEGEKVAGEVTSKLWWWGFGFSSATFFIGLDFLAGAIIMNIYWWQHRKTPNLFPMQGWQKLVTLFASVFPFIALVFLFSLFMAIGCNYPVPAKYSKALNYKTTVVGAFIGDSCRYFDLDNFGVSTDTTFTTQNPSTPSNSSPGVSPRGN